MENKNRKSRVLKIVLIIILALIIISVGLTIGIGNYFVNYALLRSGDGGDREVKNTDAIAVAEIDNEAEKIIEENRQKEQELAKDWAENSNSKKVEVKAEDGIILRGTEYFSREETDKWVIVLHGYRSTPNSVTSIGMHFSEKGYNVLIPSMRACAESDGQYIGMGWLDKDDLKCWIKLIIDQNENAEIVLHGSSMGAATVLMVSGDKLPNNVKAIIADSGYTSVWDIFASEAKARFNLPTFPVLNMFECVANIRAKYDIKEASALEQVKKATIPILFIHGDADDFVPEYMCEELYDATKSMKDKLIIHDAGHTDSKYKEPETYYTKVFEFLENVYSM
ncbi:MAG: alpha/beta hydrolase [Clostridia bacterium]|nr:alpha/beta hydrolase [Clostridia bacterium]